jgi:hypothetical protein
MLVSMDNVIDISSRSSNSHSAASGYDGAICSCGEAWFNTGPVCMTRDGEVTGYAGRPHCVSCGKAYSFLGTG